MDTLQSHFRERSPQFKKLKEELLFLTNISICDVKLLPPGFVHLFFVHVVKK